MSLEISAHVDHYSKYNYLEYELFRNNKSIGYHKYTFTRNGSNLIVDNEVEFKITKLGVDLYKYYAKGVEKYKNGIFLGFNSETNQNKKEKYVNITFILSLEITSKGKISNYETLPIFIDDSFQPTPDINPDKSHKYIKLLSKKIPKIPDSKSGENKENAKYQRNVKRESLINRLSIRLHILKFFYKYPTYYLKHLFNQQIVSIRHRYK